MALMKSAHRFRVNVFCGGSLVIDKGSDNIFFKFEAGGGSFCGFVVGDICIINGQMTKGQFCTRNGTILLLNRAAASTI